MNEKKQELIKIRNQRKQETRSAQKALRLELIELRKKNKLLKAQERKVRSEINSQNQQDREKHKKETLASKKILNEKIKALRDQKNIIRNQKIKLKKQANLERTKKRKSLLEFRKYKKSKIASIKSEKQDFLQNKNLEQKALNAELAKQKVKLNEELLAKKTQAQEKRLKKIKEIEQEKEALEKSKIELLGLKNNQLKDRRLKRAKKLEKIKRDREELRIAKEKLKDKVTAIKYKDGKIINDAKAEARKEIKISAEKQEIIQEEIANNKQQEKVAEINDQIKELDTKNEFKVEDDQNKFMNDDFKIIFDEEEKTENESPKTSKVINAVIINSYGKAGARLYKAIQKPANDKILTKLKKLPHITDVVNKYREKIKEEKPAQFSKLVPFAEGEKVFSKEELSKFFSHAVTTILMTKSLKFGDGYISKYKVKNIPIYQYSDSPYHEQVIDYIDKDLGEKLNKLVAKKLKNKAIIQITEGLMVDASNGKPEVLFDTNVMI